MRGCRAALSQEAGLRPQRKGGSVGRERVGVVGITSVGGGMAGSEVRSGQPAVRVQRSRSWWLKAQAPTWPSPRLPLGAGARKPGPPSAGPRSGRCLLDGHFPRVQFPRASRTFAC